MVLGSPHLILIVMPGRLIEPAACNTRKDWSSTAVETALVAPGLLLRPRGCLGRAERLLSLAVRARNPRAAWHVYRHVYMGGE